MAPEHMCFPSIPWQIPTLGLADVDVRAWLLANDVNFTCAQPPAQRRWRHEPARPDAPPAPYCNDTDLQMHLTCPAYSPLVLDETLLWHAAQDWTLLPTVTLSQATYSRVQNTLAAAHYAMRYLLAHLVPGAAAFGDAWRFLVQLAAHALHWASPLRFLGLPTLQDDRFSPDGWFANLWAYPRCETVDHAAALCAAAPAGERAAGCPGCCAAAATHTPPGAPPRAPTGATGAADCSACTTLDFSAQQRGGAAETWAWAHNPLRYGDARRRPRIVGEQCVPDDDAHPTAAMGLCFFVHAGSVLWCALVSVVLRRLARAVAPGARGLWRRAADAAALAANALLPPQPHAHHDGRTVEVLAPDLHAALRAAGYTGAWSAAQLLRGARRKLAAAARAAANAPFAAADAAVDAAFARADQ
jgi:hypothetical protein